MPVDRAGHVKLSTLEKLHRLRVMREEIALAAARETQRQAEHETEAAGLHLRARESALASLLNGESFAPEHYCLQAELLAGEQAITHQAEARRSAADQAERERAACWHARRHQHEQLQRARRDVERRLARKAEERGLASIPFAFDSTQARP